MKEMEQKLAKRAAGQSVSFYLKENELDKGAAKPAQKVSTDKIRNISGDKAKEVPELTYSLWYTHQANDMFGISFGATYQDESIINSASGPKLPDYTRLDMAMSITPNDIDTVRINIENLGNETYFPHSHSDHQASVGEDMNLRVSYNRKF